MANLTVTIDDDTLRSARVRALQQGTSVNAVVRQFLQVYAGQDPRQQAVAAFTERARTHGAGSGGRRWTREDLHDRAALR
jgi:plasmid stability protein